MAKVDKRQEFVSKSIVKELTTCCNGTRNKNYRFSLFTVIFSQQVVMKRHDCITQMMRNVYRRQLDQLSKKNQLKRARIFIEVQSRLTYS